MPECREKPIPYRLKDKLRDSDRGEIVHAYTSGQSTIVGLAAQFKISDYSVRMILRQAGVPSHKRTVTIE